MEARTDIQELLEAGKQALAQGSGREAGLNFARAAQIEPENPLVHLGLAEANLALGNYGVVSMACRKVQELQADGVESIMARSLLNVLDRRYDRALQDVDAAITLDPGNGYAHALRAYLLLATNQSYDAGLARARASRLSYGGRYENCFPPLEKAPTYGLPPTAQRSAEDAPNVGPAYTGPQQESVPPWSQRGPIQRQMVRTRFALSRNPRFVTTILIAINVIVFAIICILSQRVDFSDPQGALLLYNYGAQFNVLQNHDYWRIFTAMFLHFSVIHIGLNMLSLFFIGPAVEVMFGKWRYLVIYLVSGIVGGIVTAFMTPDALAAGASGAIFGVFGALGVFYLVNRRALGTFGRGAITNWLFWLGLNLVWGFSTPGIGILDHLGGLVAGMIIALLLIPRQRRRIV